MTSLLFALVIAATSATTPASILTSSDPTGFDEAAEPATDLSFDEYADLAPDSTAHVDPDSSIASQMTAAVDVWDGGNEDFLLREVTLWADDGDAAAFVTQVTTAAAEQGLVAEDAPFDEAASFVGEDENLWSRTVVWQQGAYGVMISHFSVGFVPNEEINAAAKSLAAAVSAAAPVDGVSTNDDAASATGSTGGGIPIVTVLFWMAIIGGAIWLFVTFRKRRAAAADGGPGRERDRSDRSGRPGRSGRHDRSARPGGTSRHGSSDDADEPRDLDDIIERARARGRAEREVEAIPDPTADWTEPDDY